MTACFPSQDTLPSGGFGNLIALPLQRDARDQGDTLFLDERLEPYDDQWSLLASIPKIAAEQLGELIACAPPTPIRSASHTPVTSARCGRRADIGPGRTLLGTMARPSLDGWSRCSTRRSSRSARRVRPGP